MPRSSSWRIACPRFRLLRDVGEIESDRVQLATGADRKTESGTGERDRRMSVVVTLSRGWANGATGEVTRWGL